MACSSVLQNKRRCCAIARFCLKIGLPGCPLNSDNKSIGVLRVRLRGTSTPPFSALFVVYSRAFPNWAAMLKSEPARQQGRKWAEVPLRERKMKCFRDLIELSTHPYTVVVAIHRVIWQTNFQPKRFNSTATPFLARHGLLYEKPAIFRACRS